MWSLRAAYMMHYVRRLLQASLDHASAFNVRFLDRRVGRRVVDGTPGANLKAGPLSVTDVGEIPF